MTREELEQKIKELIVSSLDLEDLTAADIDAGAPLFGEGLGLDSIDALELGMAIKKAFGVSFSQNPADNKATFQSVRTLADFVEEQQKDK
ncbi:MAG: acyl carrier protein [Kiritimatiellae bacterium]|nr:acyl carrier protein [Kiritimatiellia bacterium]